MRLRVCLFAGLLLVILSCASVPAYASGRQILVAGSTIPGSNGLRIGPDGLLYVASAVGSRIDVVHPRTGRLIRSLGLQEGISGPDDLAFSPEGQLYWTAFFTGQVMRLDASGQAELVAYIGPGVNGIGFNAAGRLFVSRVFLGDSLYEVYPDRSREPRLIKANLGGFNAFDCGPDGGLYGPLWYTGELVRIDVDSGVTTVITRGLEVPAAVKFSPHQVLHVVDQHQGVVMTVNLKSGAQTVLVEPGVGADNLAFDSAGQLYVSNAHEGGITKYAVNGLARQLVPAGLSMPAGLTFDSAGHLVVAATQSLRSYQGQSGQELEVLHATLGDPSLVAAPLTVSSYGDDKLLVSSWFANTVQIWDPQSRSLLASYDDFAVPLNAVAYGEDLIVAEGGKQRIVRRSPGAADDEVLMEGLCVPTGIAVGEGNVFIADWATGVIYQVMEEGLDLAVPRLIVSGLFHPEGMALDGEGRLLVVETGTQCLLRIDPADPTPQVLARHLRVGLPALPGYPPSWLLSGVAVDAEGRIVVSQDVSNTVVRITPQPCSHGCR